MIRLKHRFQNQTYVDLKVNLFAILDKIHNISKPPFFIFKVELPIPTSQELKERMQ